MTSSAAGVFETEAEKAVDTVLAGPLPEAVTHLLIQRRVVERVVAEFLASGELERMVASAAEDERTEQLVQRVLASPAVERMLIEVVESKLVVELSDRLIGSPEFQRVVTDAVRSAVARQSATLADDVAAGTRRLDSRVEAPVRRWTGRPARTATAAATTPVPYAGLASRAAALIVDALALHVIFLVGCAMVGLVVTVTRHRLSGSVGEALAGAGWLVLVVTYFTMFWTTAGQTPGMNLLRLRLTETSGRSPGIGRSLLRLVGALVAISFFFIGFLPVLVDDRRRALQDFLAGTVVIYDRGLNAEE